MNAGPILLVEDNPDDVELTLRALRREEVTRDVVVARDGAEALRLLGVSGGGEGALVPALVLLDVRLPKIGGLEVLRAIRAEPRTQHVPVVMLTSSEEQSDLRAAYGGGVNSFLVKPVSFFEFIEVARQLGVYWLVMNRVPS